MESEKSNKIKVVLLSSIAEDLGWNEKFLTIEGSNEGFFCMEFN